MPEPPAVVPFPKARPEIFSHQPKPWQDSYLQFVSANRESAVLFPQLSERTARGGRLFVMRNLYGASADELADDGVARQDIVTSDLLLGQTLNRFEQSFDALETDACIKKTCIGLKVLRAWKESLFSDEEWSKRGQLEWESAVHTMIGQTAEWDDTEQFAGPDVVPMQDREKRAVIAMVSIPQHSADQANIGEFGKPAR